MSISPTRIRRDERGAALVELALTITLVIGIALGTFTGGIAFFRKIALVDAAREGARYGASLAVGTDPGSVAAWEQSVRDRVARVAAGEVASSDVCAKLVYPSGGTDCGVADPQGASLEPSIHVVKVSVSKPASIEFVLFTMPRTLTAQVAARYERDTG